MMSTTAPPNTKPMVWLNLSGHMTHTAYKSPPHIKALITAHNALKNSRIGILLLVVLTIPSY